MWRMNKSVPIAIFGKDEEWLLLSKVLGRRVVFRADVIKKCKKRPTDFDDHECDEANAKSSVKCKARDILIDKKILEK